MSLRNDRNWALRIYQERADTIDADTAYFFIQETINFGRARRDSSAASSSKGKSRRGRCHSGPIADILQAAMRKVSQYKLIVKTTPELLEEEVNVFLHKQGYELHGSPFGCPECYGQALVKYEQAHPIGLPSTLQSHG